MPRNEQIRLLLLNLHRREQEKKEKKSIRKEERGKNTQMVGAIISDSGNTDAQKLDKCITEFQTEFQKKFG